ncbi:MAG: hypothetical protein AAGD25_37345 [Cyanobacteria bacterium P01_F01_bin.150]
MTSFTLPISSSTPLQAQEEIMMPPVNLFQRYQLKWRQNILYVSLHSSGQEFSPTSVAQLITRLNNSFIRCVCIDPSVGEAHIEAWAEACQQAGKNIYLRSAKGRRSTSIPSSASHELVSTVLNPILTVAAAVLNHNSSTQALCKQWCVGDRGKLFQVWQFRPVGTMLQDA